MHSIVTTFRGAVIKVEVANFCAAMDTLIDQDAFSLDVQQMNMLCANMQQKHCRNRNSVTNHIPNLLSPVPILLLLSYS